MDVCITTTRNGPGNQVRVAGRLSRENVSELLRECSQAGRPLALDLTELLFLDDAGVAALRQLEADGVELEHASPYVRLLLKTSG